MRRLSLHLKLSLVFLALLLSLGGMLLHITQRGAERHFLEFTQRLNAPIAMYMAERSELLVDGRVSHAQLALLAEEVMAINPSVEVYLIDTEGRVVAQATAANRIAPMSVSLDPVDRFVDAMATGTAAFPLLGDNPARPGERRVFSAYPIGPSTAPEGYVYAVLAGDQHASLLASLGSGYSLRNGLIMLGVAIALTGIAGVAAFFALTAPLRRLTRKVDGWRDRLPAMLPMSPAPAGGDPAPRRTGRDEIDELTEAHSAMQAMLERQCEALAEKDQQRRELIAGVSHDLRTPLTALQGYIETVLMKQESLPPAQWREYLEIALRHAGRLHRLVAELFELGQLKGGDVVLHPEPFSLAELAHDVRQDVDLQAREAGVKVVLEVQTERDLMPVVADVALVQRVFQNLLDNALRHTPAGGCVSIALSHVVAARVLVTVSDTGVGMRDSVRQRACEPRYRGENGDGGGRHAGLGLAIVERIVDLHGGKLHIASRLGEGTRVRFSLPGVVRATERKRPGVVRFS